MDHTRDYLKDNEDCVTLLEQARRLLECNDRNSSIALLLRIENGCKCFLSKYDGIDHWLRRIENGEIDTESIVADEHFYYYPLRNFVSGIEMLREAQQDSKFCLSEILNVFVGVVYFASWSFRYPHEYALQVATNQWIESGATGPSPTNDPPRAFDDRCAADVLGVLKQAL